MSVSIFIRGDYRGIDREIDRIESMPDAKTTRLLDTVLQAGFKQTQAAVHRVTGSLASSGEVSARIERTRSRWHGQIAYGGRSSGVNNPVDYAIYEKRREPDEHGDHDFMRPLEDLDIPYVRAILTGLSR